MKHLWQHRFTPAILVGTVVLLITLGGPAIADYGAHVARQLTGAEFKDNSIPASKLKRIPPRKLRSIPGKKLRKNSVPLDRLASELPQGSSGATGTTGAQGPKGEDGAPATVLWAAVSSTGQLVRGSGLTTPIGSSTGDPAGESNVRFSRDIDQCVMLATLGSPTPAGFPLGQVSVAYHGTNKDLARVETQNSAGGSASFGYMLAVFC